MKQADLVFALYACGDHFDLEQKRRDFAYYEAITVRDSSLSACIQSIVAAEVGELDLAYDYLRETALVDLRDVAGNTDDGLHLAALAGGWLAVVARLRGHARPRPRAPVRSQPAGTARPPGLPHGLPGPSSEGDDGPDPRALRAAGRRPASSSSTATTSSPWRPSAPVSLPLPERVVALGVTPPIGREPLRRGVGADSDPPIRLAT